MRTRSLLPTRHRRPSLSYIGTARSLSHTRTHDHHQARVQLPIPVLSHPQSQSHPHSGSATSTQRHAPSRARPRRGRGRDLSCSLAVPRSHHHRCRRRCRRSRSRSLSPPAHLTAMLSALSRRLARGIAPTVSRRCALSAAAARPSRALMTSAERVELSTAAAATTRPNAVASWLLRPLTASTSPLTRHSCLLEFGGARRAFFSTEQSAHAGDDADAAAAKPASALTSTAPEDDDNRGPFATRRQPATPRGPSQAGDESPHALVVTKARDSHARDIVARAPSCVCVCVCVCVYAGTNMLPKTVVSELNRFIVGQEEAKRAVAIALRTPSIWRDRARPRP